MPDFEELAKRVVVVGLPDDVIHNPSGLAMSALGALHEFGSSDGRVPARSFLRSWLAVDRANIIRELENGAIRYTKGSPLETEQQKLALFAQGGVQERIVDVNEPPNAPFTIKMKESDNPLIDTGEMRGAVIGLVVDRD